MPISVTRAISRPRAVEVLMQAISSPSFEETSPIVHSISQNPIRMGTAIDYAIRFELEARGWARNIEIVACLGAEQARKAQHPRAGLIQEKVVAAIRLVRAHGPSLEKARTSQLMNAYLFLAEADRLWRESPRHELDLEFSDSERVELRSMLALVPWNQFRPRNRMLLGPRFRRTGDWGAISSADVDLVRDSTLIEIKSSSVYPSSSRERDIVQLVSYGILANTFGFAEDAGITEVETLGAYDSRSGVLHQFSFSSCISTGRRPGFLEAVKVLATGEPSASLEETEKAQLNELLGLPLR